MSNQEFAEQRKLSLEKRLAAYSAVAGASLLAAAGADAQTIYTNFPDTTLQLLTPIYLDLNQDGPPGLGLDAADDLLLQLGTGFVENVEKGGAIAIGLFLNPLSNAYVYGLRVLGNYPTCSYGSAVAQSTCSAVPVANCVFNLPAGQVAKGQGVVPIGPNNIFVIPDLNDQFIRIGGYVTSLSGEAGKTQTLGPVFEGWIRFSVEDLGGGGGGDEVLPFEVVVKDHAIFVSPEGPVSCDASSLPVEFVSFEARFESGDLQLAWETASEINNAGFEVQYRALDQGGFAPLGFVEGAGSTTIRQQYTHTVLGLEPGKYLFRLKQIDLDGAFKFTDALEVTVEVPGTHYLSSAYPNPFNPQANFTLVVPREQSVRVELFDALGRSVSVLHEGVVAADTPVRLAIRGEDLPSGTYLYRATGETFVEAKQVVVAK